MSRIALRENAPCLLAAALGSALLGWLGLYGFVWTDYEVEAKPAFQALVHGHLEQFLRLTPAYGGSLVLRAPFALLTDVWGGGPLAVYRMVALPCLLGAAALGVWLVADMRRRELPLLARAVALGLCVANPLTLNALEVGHPEELLGAALCVGAVLLAARGRPLWAALLLGAAIANKEWALLAIGPVLLALPDRRMLCLLSSAALAAAILAPPILVHAGTFVALTRATATPSSAIFQPWQIWWFLGHHGAIVRGTFGRVKPGYRTGPEWTGAVSHPLILAISLPLGALVAWRRRERRAAAGTQGTQDTGANHARRPPSALGAQAGPREREALLLLCLLALLRCMLDTWDTAYYAIPLLLALTAWECRGRRGLPALALGSTLLAWIDFEWLHYHASPDLQAAFFLLWTVPLAVALALGLYAPAALEALPRSLEGAGAAFRRRASRAGARGPDGSRRAPAR